VIATAHAVLTHAEPGRLEATLAHHAGPLSGKDRAVLIELVRGTTRHRLALDHLLDAQLSHPRRVDRATRAALQLGAYRLLLLDAIPDHAAVDTAVQLGRPGLRGLINGVLRNLARRVESRACAPQDPCRELPRPDGLCCRLDRPVFPAPEHDPAAHLTLRFSLPLWLVTRWIEQIGYPACAERCAACNRRPELTLRINRTRSEPGEVVERLVMAGAAARVLDHETVIVSALGPSAGPAALPGFATGDFTVQDASAIAVGRWVPAEAAQVLELAAAPGGKTGHLLERHTDLCVTASDPDPLRLAAAREAMVRLGHEARARWIVAEGQRLPLASGLRFDGVLADVPCSNSGVLMRRADVRWRLAATDLQSLAVLQTQLLDAAAARVKPGGWLLYSTCSVEPEENGEQVANLMAREPGWELEREQTFLPERVTAGSGGYAAMLRRRCVR
jgi:16S rRNA (cytosine967-C5)-methyltransferase